MTTRRPRTVIITNDFPPSIGGIEAFVRTLCGLLDDEVVVLTRDQPGAADHDRDLPFEVVRHSRLLLPTAAVGDRAIAMMRQHQITRVVFGAAAPLGLLAPQLRAAGATHQLALTHGHETWWATLPGSRDLLRRIADGVDHLTTISAFTQDRIAPALAPSARQKLVRLAPPLAADFLTDPLDRRAGEQADDPPVVVAAGRMVSQKGFHTLVYAWARLIAEWPGERPTPRLRLIGDGPQRPRLQRLVRRLGLTDCVELDGSLPHSRLAAEFRWATLFALPVRTRWAGLNPEGLGLVFLEAQACGLPVLVGDSGGAPETMIDTTGRVLDPHDVALWARTLREFLDDLPGTRARGERARVGVQDRQRAASPRRLLHELLGLDAAVD